MLRTDNRCPYRSLYILFISWRTYVTLVTLHVEKSKSNRQGDVPDAPARYHVFETREHLFRLWFIAYSKALISIHSSTKTLYGYPGWDDPGQHRTSLINQTIIVIIIVPGRIRKRTGSLTNFFFFFKILSDLVGPFFLTGVIFR